MRAGEVRRIGAARLLTRALFRPRTSLCAGYHPAGVEAADMTVRSLRRAWNIRDFTVLTGHPAIAAISSHEYSMR